MYKAPSLPEVADWHCRSCIVEMLNLWISEELHRTEQERASMHIPRDNELGRTEYAVFMGWHASAFAACHFQLHLLLVNEYNSPLKHKVRGIFQAYQARIMYLLLLQMGLTFIEVNNNTTSLSVWAAAGA